MFFNSLLYHFFTYKLNSSFVGAASSANFFLTDCIAVVFQQPALLFFTYKLNNSFVGAASSATFFLKNCIAVVFHKTALPSMPHVWFLLRCLSSSLLVLFCFVKIVVTVVNFDFNWFHLGIFPPLVISLWIWISSGSYAFVKFYFILSKEDNNEIRFMIMIWTFFSRLILIRAFPDDFDDTWHFSLTFLLLDAIVLSAFIVPFFHESVDAFRDTSHPPYP